MHIELWALILIFIGSVLGSFGALLLKKGAEGVELNLDIIRNFKLIGGLFLYGISAILYMIALKGGDLSIIYPLVSMAYIWIVLLSHFILKEHITRNKIIGIALVIIGIIVINL